MIYDDKISCCRESSDILQPEISTKISEIIKICGYNRDDDF